MSRLLPGVALLLLLLSMPAGAQETDPIVEGRAALERGDAAGAAQHWERAAIADVQESYHLLVTLYESGPDPSADLAFKWAWIGRVRTWDPALSKRASDDYDRLQDRLRREVRQQGQDLAEAWLAEHPRPTP